MIAAVALLVSRRFRRTLLIVAGVMMAAYGVAQPRFVFSGKIEYERKITVHRQADAEREENWYKEMIKTAPAFHTSEFSLQFSPEKTVYRLQGNLPTIPMYWLLGPAKENIVLTDLTKGQQESQKTVFEEKFLVADRIRPDQWRISEEKRTIAGMECRKAVTVICDSVYVVAFYTDEIPVSGGPESFGGRPGMIQGLAIPRLYTTWFATRITLEEPPASAFQVNTRRTKTIDNAALQTTLQSAIKSWWGDGTRNIWWVML